MRLHTVEDSIKILMLFCHWRYECKCELDMKIGIRKIDWKARIGLRNNNREGICGLCDINDLDFTGTLFPHKTIRRGYRLVEK